jgi:hypothetical protein
MMLDRDGIIARLMFLRRQNELRTSAQMKEVAFARSIDISSMGTEEKTEYI